MRTKPYNKVPATHTEPLAIHITTIDTQPHAADVNIVLEGQESHYLNGIKILQALTSGPLFVPHGTEFSKELFTRLQNITRVKPAQFSGPHPAGLPGTHAHFLSPVGKDRTIWHLNYQDAIAIGKLFTEGKLDTQRVISFSGPEVLKPRLLRVTQGSHISELTQNELTDNSHRLISGSVLSGYKSESPREFLGRYHHQISVIEEDNKRELLGWKMPGFKKFSIKKVYAAAWLKPKQYQMTSSSHGSHRAMVPVGSYESVFPLDIHPTFLLRSLLSHDYEGAENLGCLELDEEDLSLCTYVCPGKTDYAPLLREALDAIEKGL